MQVSIAKMRESLDELVEAADAGEDVLILREGLPPLRLTSVKRPGPFKIGILKGLVGDPPPEFYEPFTEEIAAWEDKT